ncbi:hypothetical protein K438DRAFT_1124532 [Mycena galopus ATCC 62051]|nr:hypothetical protein K438DRAFT_1124532 [Mycena galopus ATCC 62051]
MDYAAVSGCRRVQRGRGDCGVGVQYVCVNSRRGAWHALFSLCDTNVLAVIPVRPLRWSLVGLAFALSGSFLDRNGYTVLASAEARAIRLLIVLVAALQVGLAITFKVLFFSYYILVPNAPVASTPPSGGDAGGNTTETGVGEVVRRIFFSRRWGRRRKVVAFDFFKIHCAWTRCIHSLRSKLNRLLS